MRLKNTVILITASTRGIGLACVKACAKEGAICYMAARNLEAAEKTATELNQHGYCIKYVYNDAGKPESFISMIDEVRQKNHYFTVPISKVQASLFEPSVKEAAPSANVRYMPSYFTDSKETPSPARPSTVLKVCASACFPS